MYIDKTYPFESVVCPNFDLLDSCLGKASLLIHYNQIYCKKISMLNELICKYPFLQGYSLDEIIYNINFININEKQTLKNYSEAVYSHHIFFSSISCPKPINSSMQILSKINDSFNSFNDFLLKFKQEAMDLTGSGYVYLVCNKESELSIFKTQNYDTPVPLNLYPLLCIDLWEHSYYLPFNTNKDIYIENFLKCLNWEHINSEYLLCKKCCNFK